MQMGNKGGKKISEREKGVFEIVLRGVRGVACDWIEIAWSLLGGKLKNKKRLWNDKGVWNSGRGKDLKKKRKWNEKKKILFLFSREKEKKRKKWGWLEKGRRWKKKKKKKKKIKRTNKK
jgi:hypothetical protein